MYESSERSYNEVALELGIKCPDNIRHWRKAYKEKGYCYDNAVMESFFGSLKQKIYKNDKNYYNRETLVESIEEFIEYYNTKRIEEK